MDTNEKRASDDLYETLGIFGRILSQILYYKTIDVGKQC